MINFFIITFTKYLKQGYMFILGMLLPIFLSIHEYGIYSWVQILITFSVFINLGTVNSMNKELSINKGDSIKRTKAITSALVIVNAICIITVFMAILIKNFQLNSFENSFWYLIGILITLQFIYLFENIFRAFENYKPIFFSNIVFVLIGVIGITLLIFEKNIFLFSIENVITLLFVQHLFKLLIYLSFWIIVRSEPFDYKNLDLNLVKKLFRNGISLLLVQFGYIFFINSDRLLVGLIGGNEKLAFYNFAVNLVLGASLLTQSLNYILYPKMLYKFSSSSSKEISLYIKKVVKKMMPMLVIFNIVYLIFVYVIIRNYFFEFSSVINIIFILLFSNIFNVFSSLLNNLSITHNKEKVILKNQLLMILSNTLLSTCVLLMGYNLVFVAIITGLSQLLYFCMSYFQYKKIIKNLS